MRLNKIRFFLLLFLAFISGLLTSLCTDISPPSFRVTQVNATHWLAEGFYEIGSEVYLNETTTLSSSYLTTYKVKYETPINTVDTSVLRCKIEYGVPTSSVGTVLLGYRLEFVINYGGNFTVLNLSVLDPIKKPNWCGAERIHKINVTIWDPYGYNYVSLVLLELADVRLMWNKTGFYEVDDPYDRVDLLGGNVTGSGAVLTLTFWIKPHWSIGGLVDVYVYANDTSNNLVCETVFSDALYFVNCTKIVNLQLKKQYYEPNETAWISGYVVYNGTTVGTYDYLTINGTAVSVSENGFFNYTFTVPSLAGNYTYVLELAHGVEKYLINITVAKNRIEVRVLTEYNETVPLEDVVVEIRDLETGELVKRVHGGAEIITEIEAGSYTITVYVHGIKLFKGNVSVTGAIVEVDVPKLKRVIDYLGRLRPFITNATVKLALYDNETRRAVFLLSGSGVVRFVYYCNVTQLPCILCNVTYHIVELSKKRVIVDLEIGSTANVTVIDPRYLKVTVINPFGRVYPLNIKLLNITQYIEIENATTYLLPAMNMTELIVDYRGIAKKLAFSLLTDKNVTVMYPIAEVICYKNVTRYLWSNATSMKVHDISYSKFNWSRVEILLSGEGWVALAVDLGLLPTKIAVESNVTCNYRLNGTVLYVYCKTSSTARIVVEDEYKLTIELLDRLGNYLPVEVTVVINGSEVSGRQIIESFLPPAMYVVEVPVNVSGFNLYGISEVCIELSEDKVLRFEYRVPSKFRDVKVVTIRETNNTVILYFEGYLIDYYGNPIVNRLINVLVYDGGKLLTNLTGLTDSTGYFTTETTELVKGRKYTLVFEYSGDDTYVESKYTTTCEVPKKVSAPIPAPTVTPLEYIILVLIGIALALAIATAVIKLRRKVIAIRSLRYI
ncbi:MAG: hypothetical protein DRJ40_08005 [Thermoprotei archaeon]|nr:MAG: hypothetical protein DRJ40_08005 [Thermoprotei archaeon]